MQLNIVHSARASELSSPPKEGKVIGLEKKAELSREIDTLEENKRLIDQQLKI